MESKVVGKQQRTKPAHLMCGSRVWTIAAFLTCSYFAWIALGRMQGITAEWSHEVLNVVTHFVWLIFLTGLLTETRCWKERIFFALVLINFAVAFGMGLWRGAPLTVIVRTRQLSAGLWVLAALASVVLMFAPKPAERAN
ncbi:MAG TPA: hypothetical protein VGF08_14230 [Terriglobales bacterium]|jgi:hypothetical protein